jgi:N-formylmaleamate deformylase
MTTWFSGFVSVNGIQLHYHRTGGQKPPVLFLHGLTDNGLSWSGLVQGLEAEFDCILLDGRGHGLSDAPADGYDMGQLSLDTIAFLDALGLSKVGIVGHSIGGRLGALLAANYPERVQSLVLEDPAWGGTDLELEEFLAFVGRWKNDVIRRRSLSAEALRAEGQGEIGKWAEVDAEAWIQSKLQVSPEVMQQITLPYPAWQETVRLIQCPALLFRPNSTIGGIISEEMTAELLALKPSFQVRYLEKAGHSIRRDCPEEFLAELLPFLRENVRR